MKKSLHYGNILVKYKYLFFGMLMSQIVEDLLSNTDIVNVISRYVDLKQSGVNFSGLCPFHNEKTPSFVVSPQKQIFKCFGCGKGGDVITFMKEIERIDFRDAVKILAKDANIDIQEYTSKNFKKLTKEYSQDKEMLKYIHKVAQSYFIQSLKDNTFAKIYLSQQRGLSDTVIQKFGISYAPDSYYDLIEYLRKKGFTDQDILKASLGKQNNAELFSFFRKRIMFPIRDTMGNIIAFSGRVLDNADKPKYLNSSEHLAFEKSNILYGLDIAKQHIKEQDKLIVVEGQMDVIGLYRLGFPVGIATSGTSLTTKHIEIMKRYTNNIYYLFDSDDAGQAATVRAIKIAYQYSIFPKIISLPEGYKDVDELAAKEDGKEYIQYAIANAQDAFTAILDTYGKKYDISSPVEKQKFLYKLFEILISVTDITIQDHYLNIISEYMMIRYEIVAAQYRKYIKSDGKLHVKQFQKPSQNKYEIDREKLLSALFLNSFLDTVFGDKYIQGQIFKEFISHIASYLINTEIQKLFQGEMGEEGKKDIQQMQLWWEDALAGYTEPQEKYVFIRKITLPIIQKYIRIILSKKDISVEQKQYILDQKRKI